MKVEKIIKTTRKEKLEITGATLLPVEEAKLLDKNILKANDSWWLRSRGYFDGFVACVHGTSGSVDYLGDYVWYVFGVRPALKINLESSNLKVGDSFEIGEYTFIIISAQYALCTKIIGDRAFRKDWREKDKDNYETSDIKKYVDDWFDRRIKNARWR